MEVPQADGSAVAHRRIGLACRWRDLALDEAASLVQLLRRFGLPTGIGSHDRLWIVLELSRPGKAALNGQPLGAWKADAAAQFDVTQLLQTRNELMLHVDLQSGLSGAAHQELLDRLLGEVRLEIRPA